MENIVAVSRKLVSRYYLDNYKTKERLMPDLNNMFGYIRYVGLSDTVVEDINEFIDVLKTLELPYQLVEFDDIDVDDVQFDGDRDFYDDDLHYTLNGAVVVLTLTKDDAKNALLKIFETNRKEYPSNKSFEQFLKDYEYAELRSDNPILIFDIDYGYVYSLEDFLRDSYFNFEDPVRFFVVGSYFFK